MKVVAVRCLVDDDMSGEELAEVLVEARHVNQRRIYGAQGMEVTGSSSLSRLYGPVGAIFRRPNVRWNGGRAVAGGEPPRPHEPRNAGVTGEQEGEGTRAND